MASNLTLIPQVAAAGDGTTGATLHITAGRVYRNPR
jgi:hypothetical protein